MRNSKYCSLPLLYLSLKFRQHLGIGKWNPNTTLPPLPDWNSFNASEAAYSQASIEFFLSAQQNISNALDYMTPAFWQSVWLQNYEGEFLHIYFVNLGGCHPYLPHSFFLFQSILQ